MNRISQFFLLGLLFCLNCSEESSKNVIEFPEIVPLIGEPITDIEVFSSGNVNLVVIDTFLVVQKAEEKFISIYNTKSYKKLAELGINGRGPSEFKYPKLIKQVGYDKKNNSPLAYIYDISRRRTSIVNIFDAINSQKSSITELEMPNIKDYLPYFFYQNDSFLLATPEVGQRFLKFDLLTGERIDIPFIPEKEYIYNQEISSVLYRSTVVVNEEKNLFAAAPSGFGQLDFFDLYGNYLKSTIFSTDNDEKLKKDIKNEDLKYFNLNIIHLQKNDDYIYALNYNNTPEEIYSDNISNNMEVQVYNWDGKPIKKFELIDKRVITSFAIDRINNRIYGYSSNEKDHNIIVYDLK